MLPGVEGARPASGGGTEQWERTKHGSRRRPFSSSIQTGKPVPPSTRPAFESPASARGGGSTVHSSITASSDTRTLATVAPFTLAWIIPFVLRSLRPQYAPERWGRHREDR